MRAVVVLLVCVVACSIPDQRFEASRDGAIDDAAPNDTLTDADDADAMPACQTGAKRCAGNQVEECQAGTFVSTQTCANLCTGGGCVTPPSCGGGVAICGTASDTCCRSLPVAAGMFSRSYDGVTSGFLDDRYEATLTAFHLDKYEVNVERFTKFVNAYPATKPAVGSGRNPRDANDVGWKTEWTALLPAAKTDLQAMLSCEAVTTQGPQFPVRCITWYVAQAFCIWDGGRLPTEAEWNYAASGGDQQRVYPWSVPATSNSITTTTAVYNGAPLAVPGSKPEGDGRFGQSDLGGNINEWVFDNYIAPYPSDSCNDCANHAAATGRAVRGGSFASVGAALITSFRTNLAADMRDDAIGFRCARDPQ